MPKPHVAAAADDRFTALPLELRAQIASFLPFTEVARLAVLSRPWRSIHLHTPVVDLDLDGFYFAGDIVDHRTTLPGLLDDDALLGVRDALLRRAREREGTAVDVLMLDYSAGCCHAPRRSHHRARRRIGGRPLRPLPHLRRPAPPRRRRVGAGRAALHPLPGAPLELLRPRARHRRAGRRRAAGDGAPQHGGAPPVAAPPVPARPHANQRQRQGPVRAGGVLPAPREPVHVRHQHQAPPRRHPPAGPQDPPHGRRQRQLAGRRSRARWRRRRRRPVLRRHRRGRPAAGGAGGPGHAGVDGGVQVLHPARAEAAAAELVRPVRGARGHRRWLAGRRLQGEDPVRVQRGARGAVQPRYEVLPGADAPDAAGAPPGLAARDRRRRRKALHDVHRGGGRDDPGGVAHLQPHQPHVHPNALVL